MFRKKFRVCYLILLSILLLAMSISGCKSSSKPEVSENAKKVIDMMMTCPNSELYNKDMFGYVGIGEEIPEEKQAKIDAAYDSAMKIWENEKQEIVVEFKYNANNLIWQVNLVE